MSGLSCRMSFCGHYVGCGGRQVKTFTYLPNTWNMDRGGNNMNRAEQIHITYMYIYVHYIYVHCTYM